MITYLFSYFKKIFEFILNLFKKENMPTHPSLNYEVWATSWTLPVEGNLNNYPAFVQLIRPPDNLANIYRSGADLGGLPDSMWLFYSNIVPTIPVGRRVYYNHYWQLDGMPSHLDQTNYYKNTADGVTYTGSISGFGDATPLKFTSIWGLSGASDGKVSFKQFLQKCSLFGLTFDYFWDDTESYASYGLNSTYNAYEGNFNQNGIPTDFPSYLSTPDPRRTNAISNDARFNTNTRLNINGKNFSTEFLDKFKDITNNPAETRTSRQLLSYYTNISTRQDFRAPWSLVAPVPTAINSMYAFNSALYTYNFGTLRKTTIVDAISESQTPNVKIYQTDLFATNKNEAKYVTDLNTHYFIRDPIPGYNSCMHNYGDFSDSLYDVVGYIPNAQTEEQQYRLQIGGTQLGSPAYNAFVKEIAKLRGMLRSNPQAYQGFFSIVSSPSYSGEGRQLWKDTRYWYELMYHICLHGVNHFNGFWKTASEANEGLNALQQVLDNWKLQSQNNKAIPASNLNGDINTLVDRVNLEQAATRGVISGGYIPSINKWVWRLTATPGISNYTLENLNAANQSDLSINITIPENSRGVWIVRNIPGQPKYIQGTTNTNFIVETPQVTLTTKPAVVSKSPLSSSPYNSRILITETELKPNALLIGGVNLPIPVPPQEPNFEQKFNKVFDYLINRYEPYWSNVDLEVGKAQAQSALGVSETRNPFTNVPSSEDDLYRSSAYFSEWSRDGWFDVLSHPKLFANAVKSAYTIFERSANPTNANNRFVDYNLTSINAPDVYYNYGGGSNTFFGLSPKFFWYPDQVDVSNSFREIMSRRLFSNHSVNYANKITRTVLHSPYGKFGGPMNLNSYGAWRTLPWMNESYIGESFRFEAYLLAREETTTRDLLTDPNRIRNENSGVVIDGVGDTDLNTIYRNKVFLPRTVSLITEGGYGRNQMVGYQEDVTVGSPWISYPNGLTFAGWYGPQSSFALNFDVRTKIMDDGSSFPITPPTLNNPITSPAGIPDGSLIGLSYGYSNKLINSLDMLSAAWGDKIEFIAYLGNVPYGPTIENYVPLMFFKDPKIPENIRYMKWRMDASVSHWKSKFKSPHDGFAKVFADASAIIDRTYHEYVPPTLTQWRSVDFTENIPVSWARDQYNYTFGRSGPNPEKGVVFGVETFAHYMFKHDAFYLDSQNTEQSRFQGDPAPRHWALDDDIATNLFSSGYDLLIGQRRHGKQYTDSIWKSSPSRKKLGEVFSNEFDSGNPIGYPFFHNIFIELNPLSNTLQWKDVPNTIYGDGSRGVPWIKDRRFRLFFLYPTLLALNLTVLDSMHNGLSYIPAWYTGPDSGWFDIRLGSRFTRDIELNANLQPSSFPILSDYPYIRKLPATPPENYLTGNKDTSEFELLYACMKAGITLGLDSLGFSELYQQLP